MRDKRCDIKVSSFTPSAFPSPSTLVSKRIVLAGGSGFVGQSLAGRLLSDGYEVIVLSRGASPKARGTIIGWDASTFGEWAKSLEDAWPLSI